MVGDRREQGLSLSPSFIVCSMTSSFFHFSPCEGPHYQPAIKDIAILCYKGRLVPIVSLCAMAIEQHTWVVKASEQAAFTEAICLSPQNEADPNILKCHSWVGATCTARGQLCALSPGSPQAVFQRRLPRSHRALRQRSTLPTKYLDTYLATILMLHRAIRVLGSHQSQRTGLLPACYCICTCMQHCVGTYSGSASTNLALELFY